MSWGVETNIRGPKGDPGTPGAPGEVPEAPEDGEIYGRQDGIWVPVESGGGASVTISDTAPVGAAHGDLWWESDTGYLYVYYNDGTSSQWVMTGGSGGGISQADADARYVNIDGDTMTGNLIVQSASFPSLFLVDTSSKSYRMFSAFNNYYLQNVTDGVGIFTAYSGGLLIEPTTPSTSSTTGALTVAGGVGITGQTSISGDVFTANRLVVSPGGLSGTMLAGDILAARSATVGAMFFGHAASRFIYNDGAQFNLVGSPLKVADTTEASSTTSGAVQIAGGLGVAMSIHAGQPTPASNSSRVPTTAWVRAYAAPLDAMAYNGLQVNGSFSIDQALLGNVFSSAYATLYFMDGWLVQAGGGVEVLASSQDGPAGYIKSARIYTTVAIAGTLPAGAMGAIISRIEGYRWSRLGWGTGSPQPVTVGFWVQTPFPGTMAVAIANAAGNRSYIVDVPVTASSVWEWKTVTIPGDTAGTWEKTTGVGASLYFCFGCGTNYQQPANTWNAGIGFATAATTNFFATGGQQCAIAGVVVLPGTSAPTAAQSQLVTRPHDQEQLTCQRYYETIVAPMNVGQVFPSHLLTATFNYAEWYFHTRKRAAPTFGVANGYVWASTTPTISTSVDACVFNSSAAYFYLSGGTSGVAAAFVDARL